MPLLPKHKSLPPDPENWPVRGDALKKALDKFDFLGIGGRDLLVEDIEREGIVLDDKHFYSFKTIEDNLTSVFDIEVAPLLTEKLKKIINDLKLLAITTAPVTQALFLCVTSSCVCFICNCLNMMPSM
jgi:hypothetical protein